MNSLNQCPLCKSTNVVPIVYGHITLESYEKNKDKFKNTHLGGCSVDDEDTYCRDCKNKFIQN